MNKARGSRLAGEANQTEKEPQGSEENEGEASGGPAEGETRKVLRARERCGSYRATAVA